MTSEESSSETGSPCGPDEMQCGENCVDVMSDDANCGTCNNVCSVVFDVGACVDGECQPTWSQCVPSDPLVLCSEVCQAEGFVGCGQCGPAELSVNWFSFPSDCDDNLPIAGQTSMCPSQPESVQSNFYRCCCEQ